MKKKIYVQLLKNWWTKSLIKTPQRHHMVVEVVRAVEAALGWKAVGIPQNMGVETLKALVLDWD